MRRRLIPVTFEMATQVLNCDFDQKHYLYALRDGMPSDMRVVGAYVDPEEIGRFYLIVESESFDDLQAGMRMGFFKPEYAKYLRIKRKE